MTIIGLILREAIRKKMITTIMGAAHPGIDLSTEV